MCAWRHPVGIYSGPPSREPAKVRNPDKDLKKDADPDWMYGGNKAFLEWSMVSAVVSNLEKDRMIGWEKKFLHLL